MKCIFLRVKSITCEISKHSLMSCIVAAVLVASHAANAGVIALDSAIYLEAQANSNGAGLVVDIDQQSQSSSLNNLSASVSATSTSPGASMDVTGSASATWVNAAQGQVRFNDIGFDSLNNTNISLANIAGGAGTVAWSYSFIADVTGQFTLDWSVFVQDVTTISFGLHGFRFQMLGAGGGQTLMNVGDIGTTNSGTTTRNIIANQQYTAEVLLNAGLFGGIATRTAFMDGTFDWSMDSGPFESVPEPTSTGLFLLGLGALALRTRRIPAVLEDSLPA